MAKAIELLKTLPVADDQPYHPALEVSMESGSLVDKIPCRICGEEIAKKVMRRHVGGHI